MFYFKLYALLSLPKSFEIRMNSSKSKWAFLHWTRNSAKRVEQLCLRNISNTFFEKFQFSCSKEYYFKKLNYTFIFEGETINRISFWCATSQQSFCTLEDQIAPGAQKARRDFHLIDIVDADACSMKAMICWFFTIIFVVAFTGVKLYANCNFCWYAAICCFRTNRWPASRCLNQASDRYIS